MLQIYNINQAERVPIMKQLTRQARPTGIRNPNARTKSMY